MKLSLALVAALLFASPALASPVCQNVYQAATTTCIQPATLTAIWNAAYASAFVYFTTLGYDDNTAAGLAEARADAAVKTYKARH
jgi:hypothetical protein